LLRKEFPDKNQKVIKPYISRSEEEVKGSNSATKLRGEEQERAEKPREIKIRKLESEEEGTSNHK
jgi:hypothetical protein